jgi:hypothetical protein
VNTGLPKSRVGRIGAATRLSIQTKMPSAAAELTNSLMIVAEFHG